MQRAIEALTHDKTIIMIAHRLKTVRNADQILVLDNAHIVQRGTHAELIQQKGLYADFVSARQAGHPLGSWLSKGGTDETSCVRGGLPGNHPCSPKELGMVRSVDVARHMEVSKPSVCHAVATLRDGGFLTMDEDHFLHLTDVGREVAEKIYERHCFFTEQLICRRR